MSRHRVLVALIAGCLTAGSLFGQRGGGVPGNVQATTGNGSVVSLTWTPVVGRGVSYRVLRATSPGTLGDDLSKPMVAANYDDLNAAPGATYYYQVVAVFMDGSTGSAAPIAVTVPAPPGVVKGSPLVVDKLAARGVMMRPTAVTGISVTGTTKSAVVTWQPVSGASSYSISRADPSYTLHSVVSGLTAATWTDPAGGVGFRVAGVYTYQVNATFPDGSIISGQTNWTRPNPTCAAPLPNQPMLAILSPTAATAGFMSRGPYPAGPLFDWVLTKNSPIIAFRVERSPQGANAWQLAGTSCSGNPSQGFVGGTLVSNRFTEQGLPPGSYDYRITSIAANEEMGSSNVLWTAPNAGNIRWLQANATTTTVTLQFRYEPSTVNAATAPNGYVVSTGYGYSGNPVPMPCTGLAGCTVNLTNSAKGSQSFRVKFLWTSYQGGGTGQAGYSGGPSIAMGALTADTVITVP